MRIWWLTVSKAADRSSKMSTEDLEAALASLRASVTESRAVSVEWPLLKPDWLLSRMLSRLRLLSHTQLHREYITSSEMYSLHLTHPK